MCRFLDIPIFILLVFILDPRLNKTRILSRDIAATRLTIDYFEEDLMPAAILCENPVRGVDPPKKKKVTSGKGTKSNIKPNKQYLITGYIFIRKICKDWKSF